LVLAKVLAFAEPLAVTCHHRADVSGARQGGARARMGHMGYRLQKSASLDENLRRIAVERIDASLAGLAAGADDAAALHELRKNIKHLRALLRLYGAAADPRRRHDRHLRDAGRAIGTLRESDALLALFDELAATPSLTGPAAADVRAGLVAAMTPVRTDRAAALAAHETMLLALRKDVAGWHPGARGFADLDSGLRAAWRAARRLMKPALRRPAGKALHEWRKRVKDHGYHARLLQPIWPAMMDPHIETVSRLGDLLGEARDCALLGERLKSIRGGKPFARRARKRHAATLAEAAGLARRLLAEKPSNLAPRWQSWWSLWQESRKD